MEPPENESTSGEESGDESEGAWFPLVDDSGDENDQVDKVQLDINFDGSDFISESHLEEHQPSFLCESGVVKLFISFNYI